MTDHENGDDQKMTTESIREITTLRQPPTPQFSNATAQRNTATGQMRNKLMNDLKNLRVNRNKLVAELFEKKAQVDDIDVAIETTVGAINNLDHQKLKAGDEEGSV